MIDANEVYKRYRTLVALNDPSVQETDYISVDFSIGNLKGRIEIETPLPNHWSDSDEYEHAAKQIAEGILNGSLQAFYYQLGREHPSERFNQEERN